RRPDAVVRRHDADGIRPVDSRKARPPPQPMGGRRTMKIIGIGAWDRSGSTILAEILGSAPGVVSVGELNNLWDRGARQNRPCACGERFWDCPFWKPVMDRAFAGSEGRRLLEAVTEAADHMTNHGLIKQRLTGRIRSEEHTSELQSRENLVCRLLLEKKKRNQPTSTPVPHS